MSGTVVDALVLDLLEWLELRDRTYEETLDARRASVPASVPAGPRYLIVPGRKSDDRSFAVAAAPRNG